MAPPQVSARSAAQDEEDGRGVPRRKVTEAVITVPAYFNDSQRQATKDAGKIAGLEVKRIINEPTAAALAYGMDKAKGDRTIAVYDLGGGTFDISIIEIAEVDGEHQFEVLSTNGDTFLGGEDFDLRLIEYLAAEFKKDQRHRPAQRSAGPAAPEGSGREGQDRAVQLAADRGQPAVHHGRRHRSQAPGGQADPGQARIAGRGPGDRSMEPVKTALKDAGLKPSEIDDVILVGGQTRMPWCRRRSRVLRQGAAQGRQPGRGGCHGRAIQGGVLAGDVKDVLLLDVTPLTLGIETMGGVMPRR
jgi:molecular chaperone DnaK